MRKLIVITWVCCTLSACGVKPNEVDPPAGAENIKHPRTYPDIETDP